MLLCHLSAANLCSTARGRILDIIVPLGEWEKNPRLNPKVIDIKDFWIAPIRFYLSSIENPVEYTHGALY